MIGSIPTMWQFPELFLMFLPMTSYEQTSKIVDIRFYLHFLRSGPWAWWAKLAYQVMLTIRGHLISPFILMSMSVGLNILIRHLFTDLWDWFMAWVPWPQLLPCDTKWSQYICRSVWSVFHGPVITPYILMTIWWRNVIPWILVPCDIKSDIKI